MNASIFHSSVAPLARLFVLLAALCLLAACSSDTGASKGSEAPKAVAGETVEGKLVLYACPMNDIPPLPAPGKCPVCGMELTPVVMGDIEPGAESHNHLDPAQLRLAGVRTAPVEKRYVTATIEIYGQVEYDDAFIYDVIAPDNGIVDRVYIRRTGEYIRTDQKLLEFYSNEIHDLENQLLDLVRIIPGQVSSQLGVPVNQVLRSQSGPPPDAQQIQEALRRFTELRARLRGYGLQDKDINQVLRLDQPAGLFSVRMPNLTSDVGGVIIENKAVQGAYVNKGTLLVRIADPHFIWLNFDAFEYDFPWLRIGQEIEFTSPARPGEVFKAKINNIDPTFDKKDRTFSVGAGFNDYLGLLRPNMSLRATVKTFLDNEGRPSTESSPPQRAPLVIPESAPLITGSRAVVYVAVPDKPGVFEGREIVLGPKADGVYVVLAGLATGEQVVVDGAFKIDSERQILAKPSMLKPEGLVRQQDYNLSVPPLPTEPRTDPFSKRQEGKSLMPSYPLPEIFTTNRNAAPYSLRSQPGPTTGPTGGPRSSQPVSRSSAYATDPTAEKAAATAAMRRQILQATPPESNQAVPPTPGQPPAPQPDRVGAKSAPATAGPNAAPTTGQTVAPQSGQSDKQSAAPTPAPKPDPAAGKAVAPAASPAQPGQAAPQAGAVSATPQPSQVSPSKAGPTAVPRSAPTEPNRTVGPSVAPAAAPAENAPATATPGNWPYRSTQPEPKPSGQ